MNKILAEYIWLDKKQYPRSKTKVLTDIDFSLETLPIWNFDGSSTGQADGSNTEVLLKPVKIFKDPFRKGDNILVLCECLNPDMSPHISNTRHKAMEIFNNKTVSEEEPWYGIEQEYILMYNNINRPIGWPQNLEWNPKPQGDYYCSIGSDNISGRDIVEKHLKMCLDTGLNISGINAEVMLGQWEYQVGPCLGINGADELIISRYLLYRLSENYGIRVSLEPKPIIVIGMVHVVIQILAQKYERKDDGLKHIKDAMIKLEKNHKLHMENYGSNNHLRMTGIHETASYDKFSFGLGTRNSSIRIPSQTKKDGKGYFEDRRPGSNMDPYIVTSLLAKTILL